MKSVLYLTLWTAILAGCANTYPLSEATLKASASMSREKALQIIQSQMPSTARQQGMCLHYIHPTPMQAADMVKQAPVMNGAIITLRYTEKEVSAVAQDIIKGTLARAGVTSKPEQSLTYEYKFDLTNMARVYINKVSKVPGACQGKPEGAIVEFHNKEPVAGAHILAFHIAPENLDLFLAAVKVVAPATRVGVPPFS